MIVFKLQKDGANAPFDHCIATTTPLPAAAGTNELYDGFVGSPSIYFVWALPQDGISAPADFNASASAYLKTVCNANKTTSTTIAGPDADGYYTVTLTSTTIPASAVMLTAGVGYTYGLTTTQPLTQTVVAGYPAYDPATKQASPSPRRTSPRSPRGTSLAARLSKTGPLQRLPRPARRRSDVPRRSAQRLARPARSATTRTAPAAAGPPARGLHPRHPRGQAAPCRSTGTRLAWRELLGGSPTRAALNECEPCHNARHLRLQRALVHRGQHGAAA